MNTVSFLSTGTCYQVYLDDYDRPMVRRKVDGQLVGRTFDLDFCRDAALVLDEDFLPQLQACVARLQSTQRENTVSLRADGRRWVVYLDDDGTPMAQLADLGTEPGRPMPAESLLVDCPHMRRSLQTAVDILLS